MTSEEVLVYIRDNIGEFDKIDLSYNRVSAAGEVLGVDYSNEDGVEDLRIMISIDGDVITDTIEVDLIEFKEDIIELHHYPKDQSKQSVYIEVL